MSKKNSTICLHDCIPMTYVAAETDWDWEKTTAWTGDVWKLVPTLRKYRPDLKVQVLDCPPSGLTVITNLNPKDKTLEENYDQIVSEYMDETIPNYGVKRLSVELDIESSREFKNLNFT